MGGNIKSDKIKILDEEVAYLNSNNFRSYNKPLNTDLEVLTDNKSILFENNLES